MRTFECAVASAVIHPLALYHWNMRISAAFLLPLHVCEVVIRNAVAEALEQQHGVRWPWQEGLHASLPGSAGSYNARDELRHAAARCTSTPSVVATLRFAFWQQLFTQRFDHGLWRLALPRVLPGSSRIGPPHIARTHLHTALQRIRLLRNRIAHHEPIFTRDLADDLATIARIVTLRCPEVERWMRHSETVTALLRQRPR